MPRVTGGLVASLLLLLPGALLASLLLPRAPLAVSPAPGASPGHRTGPARGPDGPAARGEWRFPVGERAVYDVTVQLGRFRSPRAVGEAALAVEDTGRVEGVLAYRTALEIEGGIPWVYRIDDRQVSWIAPDPIRSLRFEERLRQGDYRRDRRYRLDQRAGTYTRYDLDGSSGEYRPVKGEEDVPMPENALDEVSFLYFTRTLPLEVGETYRFRRFFEEDGNPVVLEVLRRERIRVPAGRFSTVVVRPTIRASGLFSREGEAEVYLSDDPRRVIVQIRSSMAAGRINLHLKEYRPGPAGSGVEGS